MRLGDVELDRLIDALVPLLGHLVVGVNFQRVFVFLGVGLLQQQRDIAHFLRRLRLRQIEFKVIALAQPLQGSQLLGVGGDVAALHAEIAGGLVKIGDSLIQLGFSGSDLRFYLGNFAVCLGDLGVGRGGLLLD